MLAASRISNSMPRTENNTTWDVGKKRKNRSSGDDGNDYAKRKNKGDSGRTLRARGGLRSPEKGTSRACRSTTAKAANTLRNKQVRAFQTIKKKEAVKAKQVNERNTDESAGEKKVEEDVNAGSKKHEEDVGQEVGEEDEFLATEFEVGEENNATKTQGQESLENGVRCDSASGMPDMEHNDYGDRGENELAIREMVEGTSDDVVATLTELEVNHGSVEGGIDDNMEESAESEEEQEDREQETAEQGAEEQESDEQENEEEKDEVVADNHENEGDLSPSKKTENGSNKTGSGNDVEPDSERIVELKCALEIECYKQKTRDLEEEIVPELEEWQKMAIGRKWCSNLFRAVKYLNNATFHVDHQGKLLEKALAKVGMDTEGKRRGGAEAVKR